MKQQPWMAFSIDRASPVPIFEQICAAIRGQAVSGELKAGETLPATRTLATELGVSRSTIVTAYDQLVAEGYVQGVRGSGYTLCPMGAVELATADQDGSWDQADDVPTVPKPFRAGQPDMRLFPYAQWAKTVSRVCRTNPRAMLTVSSQMGNFALRKAIARHVRDWRGIDASPHQILITAGSGDALEICMQTLTQRGDRIALEDPGYWPLRGFAAVLGLTPTFLGVDGQGASAASLDAGTRMTVLTPSHQFPLGGAMSPNRRLEFIAWAQEHDSWIVEDDYDSEFRYAGRPIPAMAGFDQLSRTIYIGSFSKIFSNSLRLGYLVVPDTVLGRFKSGLERFGVKASSMPQQALAEFMESGEFYRHLRRMRRIYSERRLVLVNALASDFSEFGTFTDHHAGMQVAFHLKPKFPDVQIAKAARSAGLTVQSLSQFGTPHLGLNGLLLGFCGFSPEELRPALATLQTVLHQFK